MTFNTLRELYLHSIETYGSNRCSSLYGGEKLTYDDFARRVDALTETFVAAGLGAGDKVALLSNNMPNWGVVYFTAAIHGLVIVPILPDFSGPGDRPDHPAQRSQGARRVRQALYESVQGGDRRAGPAGRAFEEPWRDLASESCRARRRFRSSERRFGRYHLYFGHDVRA